MTEIRMKARTAVLIAFICLCIVLLCFSQSESEWGRKLLNIKFQGSSLFSSFQSNKNSSAPSTALTSEDNNIPLDNNTTTTATTTSFTFNSTDLTNSTTMNLNQSSTPSSTPSQPLQTIFSTELDVKYPQPRQFQRCVLYDRPPRTGSSTIGKALYECLKLKGYYNLPSVLRLYERDVSRKYMISEMLNQTKSNYTASVKGHLIMSHNDLDNIQNHCNEYLYISSTSPISKRLVSQLKYSLYSGHGNKSININGLIDIAKRRGPEQLEVQESFLESYPYHVDDTSFNETNRLKPHYIIRQEFLFEDLIPLMKSLSCENTESVKSENVHEIVVSSNSAKNNSTFRQDQEQDLDDYISGIFEKIEQEISSTLTHNNYRYKAMLQLAKSQNPFGLIQAQKF